MRRFATDGASRSATPSDRARVGVERLVLGGSGGGGRSPRAMPSRRLRRPRTHRELALLGAAHDRQRELAAARRPVERARRARRRRPPARRPPRRSGRRARCRRRSAGLPSSTARTSTPSRSGSPTARAQAPRHPRRRDGDAEPRAARAPRRAQPLDALAQRGAGTARIRPPSMRTALSPSRPPVGVDERAARRSRAGAARCARSRRGCAARAGRGSCARPEETKPGVARSPRPPGLASAITGVPIPGASRSGPSAERSTSPVSTSTHGEVDVAVDARDAAGSRAPVGEGDGGLLAAQVVGGREHPGRARSRRPSRGPSRGRGRPLTGPTRSAAPAIAS